MPSESFFKRIFSKKNKKPTEVDKIFSFLASVSHHPDTIENYLHQYKQIKRKYNKDNDEVFINIYLNWEEFVINNKTTSYKKYTKETLRQAIKKEVNIDEISTSFRLIFLEKKEQTILIYESFITKLVEYINEQLGNETLVKTVKDLQDPILSKIKITSNGLDFYLINKDVNNNIEFPINEITTSFKNLVKVLYGKIELNLGDKSTKEIFGKLFLNFKGIYNAELSTIVLKIIPEKILDMDEWLSLMSKKELERQVLEKTEELTLLNSTLEKTIEQRTKELRLAYDDLKKLDEKKSEFISVAAHQLRTPLSAVKWGLAMLRNEEIGKLTTEQKDFLDQNIEGNNKVIKLVNDLLDIDLYTKNKYDYEFNSADICEVVASTIKSLNSLSAKRKIKIIWNRPAVKLISEIDVSKISIVIQNLIDNAIKYGDDNSTVEIITRKVNTTIQILVKNKGIGIPKDESEDIFQRFFRAKNAVRKQSDGMGTGLFISKNIINDHGGTISFNSTKDGETTFSVELPTSRKL